MATIQIDFNARAIDALPVPADRQMYSDPTAPTGLRLRVTPRPGGDPVKAWYWVHRIGSKVATQHIGDYPALTPDKARRLTDKRNVKADDGVDPNADKRAAREGATLADLWGAYLETYAKPHKKASSVAEDGRNWKKHLEPWGKSKRLADILQADVKTLHTRIGAKSGKYAANRVLALLSGMFSKSGKDLGIDPRDNPAHGVTRFEEKERDRVLRGDEVQSLLAAIEGEDATIRDFIKVSLFTGARRTNVLCMKWDDVSIPRAEWTVAGEETKNGEPLKVALAPVVVDILDKRPDDSPYVFPAQRISLEQTQTVKALHATGATTRDIADKVKLSQTTVCRILAPDFNADAPRHLSPPRKAWDRVLKSAGISTRTTLHDLRRSFASALINSGANLTTVASAMGHKDIRTTQKHYAFATGATVKTATLAGVDALLKSQATPKANPAKSA